MIAAVKGANRKVAKCPGARYAKLLATHEQHCAELSRAMNRWQKSRKALHAAEKRLDKAMQVEPLGPRDGFDTDPFNDTL